MSPSASENTSAGREGGTVIGAGVVIRGDIEGATDLHIAGRVIGTVSTHSLAVVEAGVVEGGVSAEAVVISGRVDGSVSAKGVRLQASARVNGDVTYSTIQIENGARINGRMTWDEAAQATGSPPAHEAAAPDAPAGESPSAELLRLTARLRA